VIAFADRPRDCTYTYLYIPIHTYTYLHGTEGHRCGWQESF
jgi:hypothetical protein